MAASSGCRVGREASHGIARCRQVCKLLQQVIQGVFSYSHAVLQVLSFLLAGDDTLNSKQLF
jgi:hypothetical protein